MFLSSAWNCSGCSLYCFSANSISIALIISPILLQPCSLAKSWIFFRESPKPNSLANLFNLSNSSVVKPDSFNFLRASSNLYSVESINSYWENCSLNLWAQFLPLQYFSYTVWRSSSLIKSSFNQYSSEPTLLTLYAYKLFSLQISSNNVSSTSPLVGSLSSVSTSTIASASPSSVSSSSSTKLITKASGFSRCVTTQSAHAAMAPTLLPLKISSEDSASSIINFSNFSSSLSNKFNKSITWIISSDTSGTSSSLITYTVSELSFELKPFTFLFNTACGISSNSSYTSPSISMFFKFSGSIKILSKLLTLTPSSSSSCSSLLLSSGCSSSSSSSSSSTTKFSIGAKSSNLSHLCAYANTSSVASYKPSLW